MTTRAAIPRNLACAAVILSIATAARAPAQSTHFASDATRSSSAVRAPRELTDVRWSRQPESDEQFVARSTPVAWGGRVFVTARRFENMLHVGNRLIAFASSNGAREWDVDLVADVNSAWTSPVVDSRNQRVMVCVNRTVYAFDAYSGAPVWQTLLAKPVVSASPLVTTDLEKNGVPANRAFITDYTGFASGGSLLALNVDPRDAVNNPYDPGQVVWSASLDRTIGNSPAYEDGVVYACGVNGRFKALEAIDGSLIWQTDVSLAGYPPSSGFYGGVSVRDGGVFAAIYSFYGGENNSALFKLRASDGLLLWSTPCERTNSVPVVRADGRIYLCGGIAGDFGSFNKIQAFQDHGSSATMLWDTHAASGGALELGGWTHQPVLHRGRLMAGRPSDAMELGPSEALYALDLSHSPASPGFVASQHEGSGGSPSVSQGRLYSIGADGLFAFEPDAACLADLDGDGVVGVGDLSALLDGFGTLRGGVGFDAELDLDVDDHVGIGDLSLLLSTFGLACP